MAHACAWRDGLPGGRCDGTFPHLGQARGTGIGMNIAHTLQTIARIHPDRPAIAWEGGRSPIAPSRTRCSASPARPAPSARPAARRPRRHRHGELRPSIFRLLYGIWRAGLSAVPMNTKLHAKEMAWILDELRSRSCASPRPKLADELSAAGHAGTLPPIIATGTADHRGAASATSRRTASPATPTPRPGCSTPAAPPAGPRARCSRHRNLLFCQPLLLRRHRLARHARHHPARRAADARLGPVRPRPHRARRRTTSILPGSFEPERVFDGAGDATPTSACSWRRPW